MSLPHTIYESKLVHSEDRRERSLAMHAHLMHLPQGESLLQRLLRRLRAVTLQAIQNAPRPAVAENIDHNRPASFSK